MTSSREILRLTAPAYGFTPLEWHYRLADLTSAMTVLGLFTDAVFEVGVLSEVLIISDPIKREKAKRWMREVAMARQRAVTLDETNEMRPRDAAGVFVPVMGEIKKFHVKPRPQIKVDRRKTPDFRDKCRQRMLLVHAERRMEEMARRAMVKIMREDSDTP
jgi:hypothetical protein